MNGQLWSIIKFYVSIYIYIFFFFLFCFVVLLFVLNLCTKCILVQCGFPYEDKEVQINSESDS